MLRNWNYPSYRQFLPYFTENALWSSSSKNQRKFSHLTKIRGRLRNIAEIKKVGRFYTHWFNVAWLLSPIVTMSKVANIIVAIRYLRVCILLKKQGKNFEGGPVLSHLWGTTSSYKLMTKLARISLYKRTFDFLSIPFFKCFLMKFLPSLYCVLFVLSPGPYRTVLSKFLRFPPFLIFTEVTWASQSCTPTPHQSIWCHDNVSPTQVS